MSPTKIRTQYPAICADPRCGASIPIGTEVKYYGRGRCYGIACHTREGRVRRYSEGIADTYASNAGGEGRLLSDIAREIECDWDHVAPAAAPYLDAMRDLETIGDTYDGDTAHTVVIYFLENSAAWRGEVARATKSELRRML